MDMLEKFQTVGSASTIEHTFFFFAQGLSNYNRKLYLKLRSLCYNTHCINIAIAPKCEH